MSNPYEILNIKQGATKDEVRRAYKKLAKQYHPDQYDNNPLRDLAEERMREVNEAYDSLMKSFDSSSKNSGTSSNRGYSNSSNSSNTYNQRSSNYQNQSNYQQRSNYQQQQQQQYNSGYDDYSNIRNDIYSGNLRNAEQKLNSVKTRDAEWNYLMGVLYNKKGWHDSAKRYLSTAVRMNPSHVEYRNALDQANFQTTSYRENYYGRRHRGGNNDMFDLCLKLWCADSMCECAGGDLIDCL